MIEQYCRGFEKSPLIRKADITVLQEVMKTQSSCVTQQICNSYIRLSLYKTIFDTIQTSANDVVAMEQALHSIKIPESLQLSNTHVMMIPSAKVMLEGYAQRILTGCVVLMLVESGVKLASIEVIDCLISLIQQSIYNIGRAIRVNELRSETLPEYNQSHYQFGSPVNSTLSELAVGFLPGPGQHQSPIPMDAGKKREPEPLDSTTAPTKKQNTGDAKLSDTVVRIVAILASKRITVRSMLQFIFTRLQKINQLHKQESNYVSLYPEVLSNPSIASRITTGADIPDPQSDMDVFESSRLQGGKEAFSNTNDLISALVDYYSFCV